MTTTATHPTGADYVLALQDTRHCFRDPELAGCAVRADALGLPRAISGNFASVFRGETVAGRAVAIKCFTRDVPDQQARFREIGAALRDVPAAWKVGFRYVDAGVVVRGRPYPVLVMEWVNARQLIPWIEEKLPDRAALARLTGRFAELVAGLEAAGIAHGDLQHGNLLVTARGELKLIDYDGMYVPALRNSPAMELGQPNYQHPRRTSGDYGPWLDRFSARVIHLSLAALSEDPGLWARLHKPGGEYLLLQKYDLEDLSASPSLAALGAVNAQLRDKADELLDLVRKPLDAIPPLEPSAALSGPGAQGRQNTVTVPTAASWIRGATAASMGTSDDAAAGADAADAGVSGSWLDDHLPPPPPVSLARPSRSSRIGWYATLAIVALFVAAGATALPAVPVTVLVVLLVCAGWRYNFGRLPEVRARRRQRRQVRAARSGHKQAEAELKWQLAARAESVETYQRELGALADRRAQIDRDAAAEYARIDRWRDQELVKLVRERAGLQEWKNRQTQNRTVAVLDRYVEDELAHHRIAGAQIAGIGRGVATALEAVGIRTAADLRGVRVERGFGRSTAVYLRHRDGREMKVPMVGEVRARNLEAWRAGLAARARNKIPAQLTAGIRAQIDVEMSVRDQGVSARESAVRAAADVQRRTALSQTQSQRESLAADEQSTRSSHAAAVVVIDRDCSRHRENVAAAHRRLRAEQRALDAYRAIRFRRYLATLTTGRP